MEEKETAAVEELEMPGDSGLESEGPREMDKAPLMLQKAAVIVAFGCLIPWLGHGGSWVTFAAAKAVVLLAMWLFYAGIQYRAGEQVPGFVTSLASKVFVEDTSRRPKNAAESLGRALGSPLSVVALLVLFGGLAVPFADPQGDPWKAMAELGMLAWASGTFVHIFAYQHGGKFNPIFPLLFIGLAISGGLRLTGLFGAEDKDFLAILGAAAVAAGSLFACYTIIEAMKQAKAEGDAKKRAASQARIEARRARRAKA